MSFARNAAGTHRVQRSLVGLEREIARADRSFVRALRAGLEHPDQPELTREALEPYVAGVVAIDRYLGAGVHESPAASATTHNPRWVRARLQAHELRSVLHVPVNAPFLVVAARIRSLLGPDGEAPASLDFDPIEGRLRIGEATLDLFAADLSLLQLRMAVRRPGSSHWPALGLAYVAGPWSTQSRLESYLTSRVTLGHPLPGLDPSPGRTAQPASTSSG